QEIVAGEADRAANDPSRRVGDQAQNGQRGDALAASGLADDPQGLATPHAIGHTVDRPDDPGGSKEMRLQVIDLENSRTRLRVGCCTSLLDGCCLTPPGAPEISV